MSDKTGAVPEPSGGGEVIRPLEKRLPAKKQVINAKDYPPQTPIEHPQLYAPWVKPVEGPTASPKRPGETRRRRT
jgi:hypothetical protein